MSPHQLQSGPHHWLRGTSRMDPLVRRRWGQVNGGPRHEAGSTPPKFRPLSFPGSGKTPTRVRSIPEQYPTVIIVHVVIQPIPPVYLSKVSGQKKDERLDTPCHGGSGADYPRRALMRRSLDYKHLTSGRGPRPQFSAVRYLVVVQVSPNFDPAATLWSHKPHGQASLISPSCSLSRYGVSGAR